MIEALMKVIEIIEHGLFIGLLLSLINLAYKIADK